MNSVVKARLGEISVGDIIQVNLRYLKATKDFNIYSEMSKFRFRYPEAASDDLSSWMLAMEKVVLLSITDGRVTEKGFNDDGDEIVHSESVPLEEHPVRLLMEDDTVAGHAHYLIDQYSPPSPALHMVLEMWPEAHNHFTSQEFMMLASLLDDPETLHLVYTPLEELVALDRDESFAVKVDEFAKKVELYYGKRSAVRQVREKGFSIQGRGKSSESGGVFYTLGLYDSAVGRDILYMSDNSTQDDIDVMSLAAQRLLIGKGVDEVNEALPKGYRLALRNIKTHPKYAFEFADKSLPVYGVLSMIKS